MDKKDSRAEILIVAGVLAILILIWLRNRPVAGNGLSLNLASLPAIPNGSTNSGVPLGLTMPDLGSGVPFWNPPEIKVPNISATYNFGNAGSCGCGGGADSNTYGGESDLAAALAQQGYDLPFVTTGY